MDLSVGKNCDATRKELLSRCTVSFETVPIYTMINDEEDIKKISEVLFFKSKKRIRNYS
jgi:thiamine biosynthesis protein ThiC